MTLDDLTAALAALDNPHRLRILALLHKERLHVSELARRIGISRPLLYMHLEKLESAGLVKGSLQLEGGTAMKYFENQPFDLHLNAAHISALFGAKPAAAKSGGRA